MAKVQWNRNSWDRPTRVRGKIGGQEVEFSPAAPGQYEARDVQLEILGEPVRAGEAGTERAAVRLGASLSEVEWIDLHYAAPLPPGFRILADAWERGYGDLEWRGLVPERVLPWYFLASDGCRLFGLGVETGAGAMCGWSVDGAGYRLRLDVRNGARGVRLGERTLTAATLVARASGEDETPFAAARAFCRALCPAPMLPAHPVYGGNDWYYAYGNNTEISILRDAALISELAPGGDNRPIMVIDDGWQLCNRPVNGGPWHAGNQAFPDMPGLARAMVDAGTRPGIWTRPLVTSEKLPDSWRFAPGHPLGEWGDRALDPSVPEVLDWISRDIARFTAWGFVVIKHDFSTFDIFGRWGNAMGRELTAPGWSFADRSRTTAEIIRDFYRALRAAAGGAMLIGCNTIGHLAAGLVELQRTGDDTSGQEWERTRRMGINTLAFRMPQHGTFFAADADCVGLTQSVPWELNRQWLDLLARSGTPLFVSADPKAMGQAQR